MRALRLATIVGTSALVASLMAMRAGAATSECSQSRGLVTAAGSPGETNTVVAGYRSKMNTVRLVSRVDTTEGAWDVGDLVCPNEDGKWELVKIRLRDKGDTAKLNAGDRLLDDYRELPGTMSAKIRGGLGNDKLVGHEGVDKLHGATPTCCAARPAMTCSRAATAGMRFAAAPDETRSGPPKATATMSAAARARTSSTPTPGIS